VCQLIRSESSRQERDAFLLSAQRAASEWPLLFENPTLVRNV